MAFSRGEDRELQPVSVSYASSAPPTSPPAYVSPSAERAFVDAEDVERWLTFPTMAGSTDDRPSSEKNSSPRLRLKDVTDRRTRQQMQEQNQPSLPESPAQYTSLRHSKVLKEWQEKEKRQLAHQSQSAQRNPVALSVGSRKKREEFRRTAKMTIAAMEKDDRGNSQLEQSSITQRNAGNADIKSEPSLNLTSSSDKAKDEKNSSRSKDSEGMHERLDTKPTKRGVTSPGIAAIRRRRELRLRQLELENKGQELTQDNKRGQDVKAQELTKVSKKIQSLKQSNNTQSKDNQNDERVFSVSPTKKIHLLKRHDACKGRSPTVKEISNDGSSALQDDATKGTIYSNEKSVSTAAKLRMIRRQMADGSNRRSPQHELKYPQETRSLLAAMDGSMIPLHDHQQKQPQIQLQTNSEGSDESEPLIAEDQDQSELENERNSNEIKVQGTMKTKADNDVDNVESTMRIKDALARSRSYRRRRRDGDQSQIRSNQAKYGDDGFGERALRNHFQSSSIPCPSVMTAGTSMIDCKSDSSQTENEVDDQTSVTTNDSEETDEGVSQLTVLLELEATTDMTSSSSRVDGARSSPAHQDKISPKLESRDSAISSNNDDASLENDSTDSSFVDYVDELMDAIGRGTDKKEDDLQMMEHASQIRLHVYDLVANDTQLDLWGYHFPVGQVFNALNSSLHSIGTGAYHVGLEINGVEYAYGANSTKALTGIFRCKPKYSPGYQYRTTIDFGNRVVKKQMSKTNPEFKVVVDGQMIIREMVNEYLGTEYDLLRKNCCTFAHDACIRLGINEDEIPSWFHNLAAAGAMTQDTLAPISQLFGVKELDEISDPPEETASDEKLVAVEVALVEDKKDDNYVADTAYEY